MGKSRAGVEKLGNISVCPFFPFHTQDIITNSHPAPPIKESKMTAEEHGGNNGI
jgi:hypothetical protein